MGARGAPIGVDVSIVAAGTANSLGHGLILARREQAKHCRYPGKGLVPLVVDVPGRWGAEAVAWAREVVRRQAPTEHPALPPDGRASPLSRRWPRCVSAAPVPLPAARGPRRRSRA